MFTFELKGKTYNITYKLKALLYFEQICSNMQASTLLTNIIMLYSFILASHPEFDMLPEELVEALDEHPTLLTKFNKFLEEEQRKQALFVDEEEDKDKKGKKKSQSKKSTASA